MHKLGEGEATMTKDEYTKMKQELEAWVWLSNKTTCIVLYPLDGVMLDPLQKLCGILFYKKQTSSCFIYNLLMYAVFLFSEYLAVFKKTVQVHEVFLQRLSSHPILSKDRNFQIFLEYDQDVSST